MVFLYVYTMYIYYFTIFYFIVLCVFMYVCALPMCRAQGDQERAPEPLKLELHSTIWELGTKSGSSSKASSALNH